MLVSIQECVDIIVGNLEDLIKSVTALVAQNERQAEQIKDLYAHVRVLERERKNELRRPAYID